MVDQREGKGEYIQWRPEESKLLIELVASCFKERSVDSNGRMIKKTVETKILPVLNEKFNCRKTYKHYINRMKILKNQYRDCVNLLHFDSKIEWNPITKKFTAPDEVWDDYFKKFPNQRHVRYETYEEYENMKLVFGNNMAIRRLERSHSQAFEVGKNEKPKQELDLANDDHGHESTEGTTLRSHSQAFEVRKNKKPKQEVDLANDDDGHEVHESTEGTTLGSHSQAFEVGENEKPNQEVDLANGDGDGDDDDEVHESTEGTTLRSHSQAFEVGENEKPNQEVDLANGDGDDDDEVHESMEGTKLHLENFDESPLMDQGDRTDDAFGDSSDDPSVTEKDLLVKICTELRSIDSVSKQMLHIMQGRSMVEEKKKKNVWDAITEIPNLSNHVRYKALTMIQKLEMRDVFINMSVEDRLGWIQCNTQ